MGLVPFSLIFSACIQIILSAPCPTLGTSAYIIVSLSPNMDPSDFYSLLHFYSRLTPLYQTKYSFFFGPDGYASETTDNMQGKLQDWVDQGDIDDFFKQTLTNSSNVVQYDSGPLTSVVAAVQKHILAENKSPADCVKKKQITLITDYVNVNVTNMLSREYAPNTQVLGLIHQLDVSLFNEYANFPLFSMVDQDANITSVQESFTHDIDFVIPDVSPVQLISENTIFLSNIAFATVAKGIFTNTVKGSMCIPQNANARMAADFVNIEYGLDRSVETIKLPWLGTTTLEFGLNCLAKHTSHVSVASAPGFAPTSESLIARFVDTLHDNSTLSFTNLVIEPHEELLHELLTANLRVEKPFTIFVQLDQKDLYANVTKKLLDRGALKREWDHRIISTQLAPSYSANFSAVCHSQVRQIGLNRSRPYHKPKHFYLAVDDMIWMTACAAVSAVGVGYCIYQKSKRYYLQQLDILNEIAMQPLQYKAAKESAKVARLPWEIKADRVHIDKEFLLGEGTISNVYLGKLKGKAPIMQWIDRAEMKQFQDCAVAVRVPRQFDEPEEDQLFREIASMRRLRSHAHIALFLGWSSQDNLVCSLLELTHMNLFKYLGQLRETVPEDFPTHSRLPYKQLYQIVWQICDGMSYIHSRNLIHRDIASRNILLTTGLRAKISGFGFCSDPEDPKFGKKSSTVKFLPVRWLAPEAFRGRFTQYSDVWSFGVLLYEVFSLGRTPYADLTSDEAVSQAVQNGRIPKQPKYAARKTYTKMQLCFHEFPERRPPFTKLKDLSFEIYERLHENPAFSEDE